MHGQTSLTKDGDHIVHVTLVVSLFCKIRLLILSHLIKGTLKKVGKASLRKSPFCLPRIKLVVLLLNSTTSHQVAFPHTQLDADLLNILTSLLSRIFCAFPSLFLEHPRQTIPRLALFRHHIQVLGLLSSILISVCYGFSRFSWFCCAD